MVYDPNSSINPLSFFFANGPNVNLKLREKIALAQMMQKRKAPANLGEGLSAIGESLGNLGIAQRLEEQDRISQQAAMQLGTQPPNAAPATPSSLPPVAAAAIASGEGNPPSQAPVQPTVQEGAPPKGTTFRPTIATAGAPPMTPALPAVPTPPEQQQKYGANDPTRLSSDERLADFRAQNPLPAGLPPVPRGLPPAAAPPARPTVADYGQKPVLAPTPPPPTDVLERGDDPRRAITMALLRQQMPQAFPGSQPPPSRGAPPPPPASPPPEQTIAQAPPAAPPIAKAPPPPAQAYVPPPAGFPQGAPLEGPSPQETKLQTILNANAQNPYVASSPAALELKQLQDARAKRQQEADEIFKARITRGNTQDELRQRGLMDQESRTLSNQQARITVGDLPTKLAQEAEERRLKNLKTGQELVTPPADSTAGSARDPRLGTPQSPQRTGIPVTPPVPPGVSPQKWAELHAPEHQKALATVESAAPELTESLSLLQKAREHPARELGVGMFSKAYQNTPQGAGFAAIMDQLAGKNFLAGYQKLKGTGQISEIEGLKTEQAQARLTRAQTIKDFDDALEDLESSMRGAMERAQRKVNQPVTAYQKTPDDPIAPDLHQFGTRGDQVVEYIGGDPKLDSSYRKLRR